MQTTNKILIHLLFWVLSFGIFSLAFNVTGRVMRIDLIYATLFHISLFYGAYLNLALVSVFFAKKKYALFIFGIALVLGTAILVNHLSFLYLADWLFPGYYLISHFEYWETGLLIMVYMLITTLLKLSYSWFELQRARQKLAQVEKENIKSELNSLKAQMNPHFLFNSLNTIYSLALKDSGKTPDAIVQLADILRYVIYQSGKDKVLLADEARIIEDYIALQKFRVDPTSKISFSCDIADNNVKVAPLLLLPLVENSFKHGVKGDVSDTCVDIDLHSTGSGLFFRITNSRVPGEQTGNVGNEQDYGMGNDNIRQRLNLIYPGKHKFIVEESAVRYTVKMHLVL